MKHTGGTWDRERWPLYFLAANIETLCIASQNEGDHLLAAVNELMSGKGAAPFESLISRGRRVLLDSGVYWLATQHAKAHDMTMNQALGLAPNEIDNFDDLFAAYTETVKRYEARLWGYIEIDQGGCANKRKTRAKLEALGLRPIPVYHPLNDGWDYFDELAQQYDRICLGNVVMAASEQRKRLLATVWERRRKYPHLWIHALGLTPNDVGLAYPMNSFDSSAWLAGVRYGSADAIQVQKPFGKLVKGFTYSRDQHPEDEGGNIKGRKLAGYNALMLGRTLLNIRNDLTNELGADVGLFDHHHG